MTQTGQRTAVIPLAIGPEYSAGDPSSIPDGMTRSLTNYMIRPNRFDGRAPFVYDSLMSVVNFLRWEDTASQVTRTIAVDTGQHLRTKNTNGTGYTATVVNGEPTGRLTDYANFLGKVYQMYDNGSGVPAGASVWDGTTLSTSPFNSAIVSRAITAFIDRLFLAYPRVTVSPQQASVTTNAYDWTSVTRWVKTNTTASNLSVASGATVCRIFPTSLSASACQVAYAGVGGIGLVQVPPSAGDLPYQWRQDFIGVDAAKECPVTLEIVMIALAPSVLPHTFAVGDVITDNGFIQRVTTGAIASSAPPSFNATRGGTTAWDSVVFTNEGSATIASVEDFIPTVTDAPNGITITVPIKVPRSGGCYISPVLKLYNSTQTALTVLTPIDISLKDGLSDGDPRKANRGMQITAGDFYFPFFNCESATSATVDLNAIIWSEIDQPKQILAKNTFTLPEVAGLPTAATVIGGRYIVFKRRGLWVFNRTTDKNVPILPERPANIEIGCIGPRALDTFGDTAYFIGEYGIYRMKADSDPEEIGGPAMREEIMSRGSGWVESQSTYNVPLLVVEHQNQEVWIYAQKGKIYVYHIPTGGWSTITLSGNPEVASMFFDFGGSRMNVAFGGYGATRFDETSSAKDTIDNTATPLAITNDIIFKPIELFAPRYEAALEEVGLFHLATASQTGQTLAAAYSLNRGSSWTTPTGYPATVDITQPRVPLPIGTLGPSVMVKLSRVGFGGAANWSISKADAKLQIKRGELPYANATAV